MKKVIIIATVAAATLLASCGSGCGCPGGAGYSQNQNIETTNSQA